jgi:histidine phosphotransferase ChpT
MGPTIDLRVAELLASRLCHDMVSPVGAVKTGVELFTEFGADADGETMGLITQSALQASEKLQFFRLAYGSAGTTASGVSVADAVALIKSVCGNQRTTVETDALDDQPPPGGIKLMLNGTMLAGDCLPRGGVLRISCGPDGGNGYAVRVVAHGERAGVDDELSAALSGEVDSADLTPKSAHAYYTSVLARGLDGGLAIETSQPDEIVFRFSLPNKSA